MMHPLVPDLSGLTMDELMLKYNDLNKKMTMAQRVGSTGVLHQMSLVLENYRNEIATRQAKILEDVNRKSNFKNIIDIQ